MWRKFKLKKEKYFGEKNWLKQFAFKKDIIGLQKGLFLAAANE